VHISAALPPIINKNTSENWQIFGILKYSNSFLINCVLFLSMTGKSRWAKKIPNHKEIGG
jgi:hypothetical protein